MDATMIVSLAFVVAFIGFLFWRAKKKRVSNPSSGTTAPRKRLPGDEDRGE